jgi:hypothetical protein
MTCGAETEANALMTSLLAGVAFDVPTPDLSGAEFEIPLDPGLVLPVALTNADLTTGVVGGAGTFDQVMKSILAHLGGEYEKNRITGEQFTKAYIELTSASLGNAVQYLLGRDQAYWGAVAAQMQAKIATAQFVTARVQLEIAKADLAAKQYEAKTNEANYALTKLKLATESIGYCVAKFQLDEMLPVQKTMLTEQMEAARAQTMDTRSDGLTMVVGVLGKQKALYDQQITSYKRDAETKAAKLFTDAWITQKTIDEGLLPPGQFANANLDIILNRMRVNLELDS